MKASVLILVVYSAGAANIKVHDDADIAKAADEEVQGLSDLSNKGLWQEAWSQTLAKHDASDALMNDGLKRALYPEAQDKFQNLIQARHRLKEKMQVQQDQEQQQEATQNAGQQQDKDFFENAKAGFLQRMTAGIKDIKDDDPPSTTTATTTTEDPQVVKEREQMEELKAKEMSKMTDGVAETKEEDAPSTTTTTMDPAAKAEKDHFEQLKSAEMLKLTSNLDDKSIDAAEATATTTTTTSTTTMSLGEAGKKIMAEITSGKFVLPNNFAGLQTPQQPPQQEDKQDDEAMSETMSDLDEFGF